MEIINNANKDMVEVRCTNTGLLLGWIPSNSCGEDVVEIVIPLRASASTSPYLNKSVSTSKYQKIALKRINMSWRDDKGMLNTIATYHTFRSEWEKLARKGKK